MKNVEKFAPVTTPTGRSQRCAAAMASGLVRDIIAGRSRFTVEDVNAWSAQIADAEPDVWAMALSGEEAP